jgi:cell division protein FtsB
MRRLFPLLILVFAAASLLTCAFGDSGLLAYRSLAVYRARLAANVADLEGRQAALQARLADVRTDPDEERILARGLGLYAPGEKVVKIEGAPASTESSVVGDLLRYHAPAPTRNAAIKTVAAGGALVLLVLAFLRFLRERRGLRAGAGR